MMPRPSMWQRPMRRFRHASFQRTWSLQRCPGFSRRWQQHHTRRVQRRIHLAMSFPQSVPGTVSNRPRLRLRQGQLLFQRCARRDWRSGKGKGLVARRDLWKRSSLSSKTGLGTQIRELQAVSSSLSISRFEKTT